WPFWSEKSPARQVNGSETETKSLQSQGQNKANEASTLETATGNISESPATKEINKKNARSVRDWIWPF
ncbi:MAG: hypothetical protein VXV91_01085, partial [Verrucomicrobiota bacterium]|nr:hypothetical protein [Verrucomicrobiota bacterium]MEC7235251.1 hypothetical protein [Verrucomicrobiota bacterium]